MEGAGGDCMVSLAIRQQEIFHPEENIEIQNDELKWCSVSLSEMISMGKRLEASVYDVDSRNAQMILDNCKYEKKNLISSDGFVSNAHYGGRLKRLYVSSDNENAIGFIGSSEMLDIKPVPVKFMLNNEKADSLRVKKDTVLISRSGTIGNLTIVNDTLSKLLVSEHAIRLECKEYPGYIYAFLKTNIGQAIIKSKIYGAVIQQIEPEHLADIPVPNPPENIKIRINELVMQSFKLRDESNDLIEQATKQLIDELKLPPLNELKIEKYDNNAQIDNFSIKLSEMSGRADASYHVPVVKAIINHISQFAAEVTTIGDKRVSKAIILPGRFKRVYVEEGQGRIFFGGKQLYELDPSNKKYLSLAHHGERIKKELEILENTILITRSGTIGKVMLAPKNWEHWIANEHIIRVIPATEDIAGYLSIFLSTEYGYNLITRYTYGSVVDEIDATHVSQIAVPILKNVDAQKEINKLALEANAKRYESYKLEQKALTKINEDVIYSK